jgi:hypothetical protein
MPWANDYGYKLIWLALANRLKNTHSRNGEVQRRWMQNMKKERSRKRKKRISNLKRNSEVSFNVNLELQLLAFLLIRLYSHRFAKANNYEYLGKTKG